MACTGAGWLAGRTVTAADAACATGRRPGTAVKLRGRVQLLHFAPPAVGARLRRTGRDAIARAGGVAPASSRYGIIVSIGHSA